MAESVNPEPEKVPAFEEALDQLEGLIEELESGETPLAELVEKYDQGHKLLAVCRQHLETAELRIRRLQEKGPELDEITDSETA